MSDEKRKFFISYTTQAENDIAWAKWLCWVIENKLGGKTIMQEYDFAPGDNFKRCMHDALQKADVVMCVLTKTYMKSANCTEEWTNAERIIPVKFDDCKPDGLLTSRIYINLHGLDKESARNRFIDAMNGATRPIDEPDAPFAITKPQNGAIEATLKPSSPQSAEPEFPDSSQAETSDRPPKSLPPSNLPLVQNDAFTGRETQLSGILKGFESGDTIALTQTIKGLGGLGKTQIALEYAYRYAHKYDLIWWIPAESEMTVLSAYKDLAVKKGLLDKAQNDSEVIIDAVLDWMNSNSKWLFIYDNAEHISSDTVWWPKARRENILVTTRDRHFPFGKDIDISVFSKSEAVDFMKRRTKIVGDLQSIKNLAARLGHLPLALEQAAAYIKINDGCTYGEYLSLLDEYGLELLEDTDGVGDYKLPVAATFEISTNKIYQESARQLLYMCAYMAPEDIDEALFRENAQLLPAPLNEAVQDRLKSREAYRQLTRYALIEKQKDEKGYSMHRLLQETVRIKIAPDPQWARHCLSLFTEVYDLEYGNIESHNRFIKLTPHVGAFLNVAEEILTDHKHKIDIANLLHEGGSGLKLLGNYPKALEWQEKALAIRENVLGKENPDTATTYNNIAGIYYNQGEYDKALVWYQKALDIKEKVLGKEHPDTATSYNDIAIIYNKQGECDKALEWHQKALTAKEKRLGKDNPSIATTYNNIARVYNNQSEYDKALELYQKALDIREKMLGKEHPFTATTYNNIAIVYYNQGEYDKALVWYQKALAIREKVFGKEHPNTKSVRENIKRLST